MKLSFIGIATNKHLEKAREENERYRISTEQDTFTYGDEDEEPTIIDSDTEQDEEPLEAEERNEEQVEVEELTDRYFGNCKNVPPHPDIFKEFVLGAEEYNLEGCFLTDGKLWKKAMYKGKEIANMYICEDMRLYSIKTKQLVTKLTYLKDGTVSCSVNIDKKSKRVLTQDILASTFLKTPENAITYVYKTWNKTGRKYVGQKNHFSNIRWLTSDDFCDISNTEGFESYKLSRYGDVYSVIHGNYKLITETCKENGLRRVEFSPDRKTTKIYNIHNEVAKHFVPRPNKTYKYVVHRDGDLSNNHYKNLVWLKTLSGVHNDRVRYFEIPNCPGYAVSETNIPYSFKFGTLKKMTLTTDKDGYEILGLTKEKGKTVHIRFHRIISVIMSSDYHPDLDVDHKDTDRKGNRPENLRNVDRSTNIKNVKKYPRGKQIHQMDLKGNVIETFENSLKAEAKLRPTNKGLNNQNILKCAAKNEKSQEKEYDKMEKYRGFIWKFVTEREKYVSKPGEIFKSLGGIYNGVLLELPNYVISQFGTIMNINKPYKKAISKNKYPMVTFGDETWQVHTLVALVFVPGKTEERTDVNHIDENPGNFHASNLEWSTPSENSSHSAYKRHKPLKKICAETGNVLDVYSSRLEAARACGGTPSQISAACKNENFTAFGFKWKNLQPEEYHLYPDLKIKRSSQ